MTQPQSAGWYDDPFSSDTRAERYWDGQDWTPRRRPKKIGATDPITSMGEARRPSPRNDPQPQDDTQNWNTGTPSSPLPPVNPPALPGVTAAAGLKQNWVQMPKWAQIAVIGAPILLVLTAVLATSNSRDEGSYQYGRTSGSVLARPLWNAAKKDPQLFSNIGSPRDACRIAIETGREGNLPGEVTMRKFDIDDLIDGCTDVLDTESRLGY